MSGPPVTDGVDSAPAILDWLNGLTQATRRRPSEHGTRFALGPRLDARSSARSLASACA